MHISWFDMFLQEYLLNKQNKQIFRSSFCLMGFEIQSTSPVQSPQTLTRSSECFASLSEEGYKGFVFQMDPWEWVGNHPHKLWVFSLPLHLHPGLWSGAQWWAMGYWRCYASYTTLDYYVHPVAKPSSMNCPLDAPPWSAIDMLESTSSWTYCCCCWSIRSYGWLYFLACREMFCSSSGRDWDCQASLVLGTLVQLEGLDLRTFWQQFEFEHIHLFCAACGRIGHRQSDCKSLSPSASTSDPNMWKYT